MNDFVHQIEQEINSLKSEHLQGHIQSPQDIADLEKQIDDHQLLLQVYKKSCDDWIAMHAKLEMMIIERRKKLKFRIWNNND